MARSLAWRRSDIGSNDLPEFGCGVSYVMVTSSKLEDEQLPPRRWMAQLHELEVLIAWREERYGGSRITEQPG